MIKNFFYLLIILLVSSTISIQGCPTCEGRVNEKSKTFFSDEEGDDSMNTTQGGLS